MAYRNPKTGLEGRVSQEKLASEAYHATGGIAWNRQSRYSGTLSSQFQWAKRRGRKGWARGTSRHFFHSFPSCGGPVIQSYRSPIIARLASKHLSCSHLSPKTSQLQADRVIWYAKILTLCVWSVGVSSLKEFASSVYSLKSLSVCQMLVPLPEWMGHTHSDPEVPLQTPKPRKIQRHRKVTQKWLLGLRPKWLKSYLKVTQK